MNRKILNLAIPNIISNLTIPLLGMVDLAIVGHLNSNKYIGTIALGTTIFNIVYWAFAFLRMGSSGITAQAYGARNFNDVMSTLLRGLMVAIGSSLLILILQKPVISLALYFIDGSPEVETLAKSYFYIRIWAAPATISLYALTGWFIGMQNTKIPMTIAIMINIFNIILNFVFVYGFGLTSDGVAWGTLLAQYLGLLSGLTFLLIFYRKYFKYVKFKNIVDTEQIKRFFRVNADIFVRTLSLLAVFTFFTSKSASFSDEILAANSLLLQFLFIFSYLTDGFAYAAEALTGKFYGAKQNKQLNETIRLIFIWGGIISIGFTILYLFGHKFLLSLLTNQTSIINVALQYTFWIVLIPIVSIASFIWDGICFNFSKT